MNEQMQNLQDYLLKECPNSKPLIETLPAYTYMAYVKNPRFEHDGHPMGWRITFSKANVSASKTFYNNGFIGQYNVFETTLRWLKNNWVRNYLPQESEYDMLFIAPPF